MSALTIIVAATKSNGIGRNGLLSWRLPKEIKYFAKVTTHAPDGHRNAVIMGRNTWESIPLKFRPLPKRLNVVISRNTNYPLCVVAIDASAVDLESSLPSALERSKTSQDEIPIHRSFIIGGASLYTEAFHSGIVDRVLLTRIISPEFPDCDVHMPDFIASEDASGRKWRKTTHGDLEEWVGFEVPEGIQEENGINYEFQMWVRDA
ncbi:dihydrofolate reductase-like domain-containing protein [Cyathus striatus]|nr:dihydrofolate reductase-like domain-containing protein [Cyathus striatus]